MAREKIATKGILEDLSGVTIAFTDGNTLQANLSDLSQEMIVQLALHGLSQKLGDAYSGEKDLVVARTKAENVLSRLVAGDWRAAREAGAARITDLAKALAEVASREIEEAVIVIENMSKEEKADLRKHPQIKAKMAQYSAERAIAAAEKAETNEGPDLEAIMG